MTMSDRDRKIVLLLVPVILIAAFWFFVLKPVNEDVAKARTELSSHQERADQARGQLSGAQNTKQDFATDYAEIVRLGKAIPSQVDMPSLIVQLDRAAAGTGARFTRIAVGDRQTVAAPVATPAPAAGEDSAGGTPVDAGGEAAQSAPGGAVEGAEGAAETSDQANTAAEQSGVDPADTQTSTASGDGGLPVGGGPTGVSTSAGASPSALETIPLELSFEGNFFDLSDFFHQVKRLVRVANEQIVVNGRLISIESVSFVSDPQEFPRLKATLTATVYLSPRAQGATAGATPSGPGPDAPIASGPADAPVTPTATASP